MMLFPGNELLFILETTADGKASWLPFYFIDVAGYGQSHRGPRSCSASKCIHVEFIRSSAFSDVQCANQRMLLAMEVTVHSLGARLFLPSALLQQFQLGGKFMKRQTI